MTRTLRIVICLLACSIASAAAAKSPMNCRLHVSGSVNPFARFLSRYR